MMRFVEQMKKKVLGGELITREEAVRLWEEPLLELREAAEEIRKKMCGSGFLRW